MATLPLVINGQLVDIDQLSGFNYVAGYPELAGLLWRHCQNPAFGYTLQGMYIYPIPGRQKIFALPGRSWAPGQRLKAYRFGNSGDYRIVFVHKYDKNTGELWIEVVASPIFTTPKMGATGYYLAPHFVEPILSAAAPIASGGTGGVGVDEARLGLQIADRKNYASWFTDFIFPESYVNLTNGLNTVISRAFDDGRVATALPGDFAQHPGTFLLGATAGGNGVAFGSPYLNWTDFSGDNTVYECSVLFNTLASSGNYAFQCGLLGAAAGGHVRCQYTDNVNSGRFTLQHGIGGGNTVVNTTLTVATGTWYRIRLSISSTNIALTINNTQYATVSKTSYQGVSQVNLMTPMIMITPSQNAVIAADYMYFLKHFPAGR
jgi:hypothetical protein